MPSRLRDLRRSNAENCIPNDLRLSNGSGAVSHRKWIAVTETLRTASPTISKTDDLKDRLSQMLRAHQRYSKYTKPMRHVLHPTKRNELHAAPSSKTIWGIIAQQSLRHTATQRAELHQARWRDRRAQETKDAATASTHGEAKALPAKS